jgi:uncharacterized protein (UPF0332 family)
MSEPQPAPRPPADLLALPRPGIARARQELGAARLLRDGGYPAQAVSRAFHAACFAAEAALGALGETRDRPSDVVSAFVRRVVRERAMDPVSGRLLRSLFNRAALADRTFAAVPGDEADAALADAELVVAKVGEWLDDPARSTPGEGGATRLPARPAKRRRTT